MGTRTKHGLCLQKLHGKNTRPAGRAPAGQNLLMFSVELFFHVSSAIPVHRTVGVCVCVRTIPTIFAHTHECVPARNTCEAVRALARTRRSGSGALIAHAGRRECVCGCGCVCCAARNQLNECKRTPIYSIEHYIDMLKMWNKCQWDFGNHNLSCWT